jgi:hypothetical protein
MRHRLDTIEGVAELKMMLAGDCIEWTRRKPGLKRDITIYPEALTLKQRERLEEIEQELLEMANDATEETTINLKGNGPEEQS